MHSRFQRMHDKVIILLVSFLTFLFSLQISKRLLEPRRLHFLLLLQLMINCMGRMFWRSRNLRHIVLELLILNGQGDFHTVDSTSTLFYFLCTKIRLMYYQEVQIVDILSLLFCYKYFLVSPWRSTSCSIL